MNLHNEIRSQKTSANIAINRIIAMLITRFFGLHFCRRQYRPVFNHFDVIGPKAACGIWLNDKITAITYQGQ